MTISAYRTVKWTPPQRGFTFGRALQWPDRYQGDVLPYALDMTLWDADANDYIVSASAKPTPGDLLCSDCTITNGLVQFDIAGGSPGLYSIAITMLLASGDVDQQVVTIRTLPSDVTGLPLPRSPILLAPGAYWSNGQKVLAVPNWAALPYDATGLGADQWWLDGGELNVSGGSTMLPTSIAGLRPGQLWNNGGAVWAVPVSGLPFYSEGLAAGTLYDNGGPLAVAGPAMPRSPILLPPGAQWTNGTEVLTVPDWYSLPASADGLPANQFWRNGQEISLSAGSTMLPASAAGLAAGQLYLNGSAVWVVAPSGLPGYDPHLPSGTLYDNGGPLAVGP